MSLLLMRHGEAENRAYEDSERALTDYGRKEVSMTAARLGAERMSVDSIVVSPFLRARQTADIVVTALSLGRPLVSESLTPDSNPTVATTALSEMFADVSVGLAVFHQPLISRLILYLTGLNQPMRTASLAMIDVPLFEQGCCDLKCVL